MEENNRYNQSASTTTVPIWKRTTDTTRVLALHQSPYGRKQQIQPECQHNISPHMEENNKYNQSASTTSVPIWKKTTDTTRVLAQHQSPYGREQGSEHNNNNNNGYLGLEWLTYCCVADDNYIT
jgi:uncharacterized protein YccT (UPF0319 family)